MELKQLSEAIDGLFADGAAVRGDRDSIMALQRQLSRLEAYVTECTAVFDQSLVWAAEGAKSPAQWLVAMTHVPGSDARRRVDLGRVLPELPLCAEAFRDGTIGAPQARAVCAQHRDATKEALVRDQATLIEAAGAMGYDDFRRVCTYWAQQADPEEAEQRFVDSHERRFLSIDFYPSGHCNGTFKLDAYGGTIVQDELYRLEQILYNEDCAAASERLGRDPEPSELGRTTLQRKADAWVEMATRSRIAPANGIRPAPLFSVLVGWETLRGQICELGNGTVVPPRSLVPHLGDAYFERAIFSLANRVDVSVKARLFSGATRRAIELRDQVCQHPLCSKRAEQCQVDHIEEYSLGGLTTQENGRLLCGFHNRLRNLELAKKTRSGRAPPIYA